MPHNLPTPLRKAAQSRLPLPAKPAAPAAPVAPAKPPAPLKPAAPAPQPTSPAVVPPAPATLPQAQSRPLRTGLTHNRRADLQAVGTNWADYTARLGEYNAAQTAGTNRATARPRFTPDVATDGTPDIAERQRWLRVFQSLGHEKPPAAYVDTTQWMDSAAAPAGGWSREQMQARQRAAEAKIHAVWSGMGYDRHKSVAQPDPESLRRLAETIQPDAWQEIADKIRGSADLQKTLMTRADGAQAAAVVQQQRDAEYAAQRKALVDEAAGNNTVGAVTGNAFGNWGRKVSAPATALQGAIMPAGDYLAGGGDAAAKYRAAQRSQLGGMLSTDPAAYDTYNKTREGFARTLGPVADATLGAEDTANMAATALLYSPVALAQRASSWGRGAAAAGTAARAAPAGVSPTMTAVRTLLSQARPPVAAQALTAPSVANSAFNVAQGLSRMPAQIAGAGAIGGVTAPVTEYVTQPAADAAANWVANKLPNDAREMNWLQSLAAKTIPGTIRTLGQLPSYAGWLVGPGSAVDKLRTLGYTEAGLRAPRIPAMLSADGAAAAVMTPERIHAAEAAGDVAALERYAQLANNPQASQQAIEAIARIASKPVSDIVPLQPQAANPSAAAAPPGPQPGPLAASSVATPNVATLPGGTPAAGPPAGPVTGSEPMLAAAAEQDAAGVQKVQQETSLPMQYAQKIWNKLDENQRMGLMVGLGLSTVLALSGGKLASLLGVLGLGGTGLYLSQYMPQDAAAEELNGAATQR